MDFAQGNEKVRMREIFKRKKKENASPMFFDKASVPLDSFQNYLIISQKRRKTGQI